MEGGGEEWGQKKRRGKEEEMERFLLASFGFQDSKTQEGWRAGLLRHRHWKLGANPLRGVVNKKNLNVAIVN